MPPVELAVPFVELTPKEREWLAAARAATDAEERSSRRETPDEQLALATTEAALNGGPVLGVIPAAWFYAVDISLQPAPLVLGDESEQLVSDVAQVYATMVQRPVLVLSGPAPTDAQVLPVSGVTGLHVERELYSLQLDQTVRAIHIPDKHA